MSNPKWSKTALAQAVGMTVVGAAVGTDIQAQENKTPTLSITNYNLGLSTSDMQIGKYGAAGTGRLDSSDAYRVALTIPLQPTWDVRISANKVQADGHVATSSSTSSGYYGYGYGIFNGAASINLDSSVIDFEAGHHINLGNQDVRVFAGLRYVDLKSDLTTSGSYHYAGYGTYPSYSADTRFSLASKLEGYGVRAGAETSIPFNKNFSASGMAAVNIVHGSRENKMDAATNFYGPFISHNVVSTKLDSDHGNYHGADVEFALNWDLSPETEGGAIVSLGYSWSKTWNILNTNFGPSTVESDLEMKGAFLRMQFSL